MSTLTVGVGMQYATIAKAVAASHNNDVIQVQAGTYTNDFLKVDDSITLESIGGMATITATTTPLENKGIVIVGEAGLNPNVTIEGFLLTGAKISASAGNNGAGIRYESGNLTLDNDVIRNNQDGILATPYLANTGTIIVNTSTFSANGAGDGQSHNLYINQVKQFTFEDSVSVGAIVGHDIKSRAANTTIISSTIGDGPTGTASYEIDLPNGGKALIQGNTIEQGPDTRNPIIISYGEEGGLIAGSTLTVTGNTILNDLSSGSSQGIRNTTAVVASVTNNHYYGLTTAKLESGPATLSGNTLLATEPPFLGVGGGGGGGSTGGGGGTGGGTDPTLTVSQNNGYVHATAAATSILVTGTHDYIYGGAGGITLTASGSNTSVITAAGSPNVINMENTGHITSAGSDVITTSAYTVGITASGSDTIHAGAGSVSLTGLAGSTSSVVGGAGRFTYGGDGGTLDYTGAAGTAYLTLRSDAATIAFGSGATEVHAGSGIENFVFRNGADGGWDLIAGFNPANASLTFQGFTGSAIASETFHGGSTYLKLTDGTSVTFQNTPSLLIS